MNHKIRWGLIGPGYIAGRFVKDIHLCEDAVLHAFASRDLSRAKAFASKNGAPRYYDSHLKMLEDKEVDIVYIATPNSLHKQQSIDCLQHFIPVIWEKPASLNRSEVDSIVTTAKQVNTFWMEALWTRFNPAILKVLDIIKAGDLGEIRKIQAAFCFEAPQDPRSALYRADMGGGSILDIGIYPVFLSYLLLGIPNTIRASAILSKTGIDQSCEMSFFYDHEKCALLYSSIMVDSERPARIEFSEGEIFIQPPWYNASSIQVVRPDREVETIACDHTGEGFIYEILECHRCLKNDWIQSPHWSHRDSLNIAGLLDEIREKVGVRFPVD